MFRTAAGTKRRTFNPYNPYFIMVNRKRFLRQSGLCSRDSYVKNIGHDGSGVHCGRNSMLENDFCRNYPIHFESNIEESNAARKKLSLFFKSLNPSLIKRITKKIIRIAKLAADYSEKSLSR